MQFNNVTCPHCGLLCDDLSVEIDQGTVKLTAPRDINCSKAFADATLSSDLPSPKIGAEKVSLDEAITKASEILAHASQPLINGLIADVQACRAAVALTEKVGGVIDHANGRNIRPNVAVMQRLGKVKTTLAEARNRADNIIIFGSHVLDRFPRLIDRILKPKQSLGSDQTINKSITVLDIAGTETSVQIGQHESIKYHQLKLDSLDSIMQTFQNVIHTDSENVDGEISQILHGLKDQIYQKNYTVLIWSTSWCSILILYNFSGKSDPSDHAVSD